MRFCNSPQSGGSVKTGGRSAPFLSEASIRTTVLNGSPRLIFETWVSIVLRLPVTMYRRLRGKELFRLLENRRRFPLRNTKECRAIRVGEELSPPIEE